MEDKELDLSQVNQVDMECDIPLDDDDLGGFGNDKGESESRPVEKKTGIILNFGDDDTEISFKPQELEVVDKPIVKQMDFDENEFRPQPVSEEDYFNGNFKGYNAIDMECSIGEDDDFDVKPASTKVDTLQDEDDKELVNEEIVKESVKKAAEQISQGKVEDDYYDKLKKKHAKTNVKGAYNTHFHFAADPEQEMQDFNHDMTPQGSIPNATTVATADGGEGMVMGEANETKNYRKLFEELLFITGFELVPDDSGKCRIKDKFSSQPEQVCSTINDVEDFLRPYVEDCFIIPLQIETGEKFTNCKDWSN